MKTLLIATILAFSPALFAQTIGHTTLFSSYNTVDYVVGLQSDNPATVAYDITVAYTLGDSTVVCTKHSRVQRLIYPANIPLDSYYTAQVFTLTSPGKNTTFHILSVSVEEIQAPAIFVLPN